MLQQTQVKRVIDKYQQFLSTFPDFQSLAKAPLSTILKVWQGLGYNRRALALKEIAEIVIQRFGGVLPSSPEMLNTLPGIGRYTAAAICTFAYNQPMVFIETNIRTVFIHLFFPTQENVKDEEILPLIEQTLDSSNPREWYFALMDYGGMLKKKYQNPARRSSYYHKQSPFKDSDRRIRGLILKLILEKQSITEWDVVHHLKTDHKRIAQNLTQLTKEGFIKREGDTYIIAKT
jgi:A/G-specific adenine glycosylase